MPSSPAVWPYPRLIAHRGAGRHAPENTLAALRLGHTHGLRMAEYDVQLSLDGQAVLLHDDTLARTSNGGNRRADTLPYAELALLDAGAWHGPAYAGEPLPSLQAAAAYTLANGLCSNIEIKPPPGTEARCGEIVAQAAARLWKNAVLPPLLSSFSLTALEAARRAAPLLPRALLLDGPLPPDWLARVRHLDALGVNLADRHLDADVVREVRAAGCTVVAWTVNSLPRARELARWGCLALVTDETAAFAQDAELAASFCALP